MRGARFLWVIPALGAAGVGAMLFLVLQSPAAPSASPAPRLGLSPTTTPTVPSSPAGEADILVEQPQPNTAISGNRVIVKGRARGSWFFEGIFPVRVLSTDGTELGHGTARAIGDWMTTDFVPFSAEFTIDLTTPTSSWAILVLEKSNPSGLPEHRQALKIPISICGVKFCD